MLEASTAAIATLAFGISPLMQYASPVELALASASLASVVFWVVMNLRTDEPPRSYIVPSVGLALAAGSLIIVGMDAIDDYASNQTRCADIQKDMLSRQPRRTDGSALFQALGCKPHGDESVSLPPPVVRAPGSGRGSPIGSSSSGAAPR